MCNMLLTFSTKFNGMKSMNNLKMVRNWQKLASIGRRRIMLPKTGCAIDMDICTKSKLCKGHFVVYTADGRRFEVPLAYLSTPIFKRLFEMSEEEFGFPGNGPIRLPCDAIFMDYIVSIVGRCACKDVENALLGSMAMGQCSMPLLFHQRHRSRQMLLHGF